MKIDFHTYRQPVDRWLVLVSLLLVVGLWGLAVSTVKRHAELTPLHYTIYFGIDLTGPTSRLLWWPVFGTVSWLSHFLIGRSDVGPAWTRSWLLINLFIEILILAAMLTLMVITNLAA